MNQHIISEWLVANEPLVRSVVFFTVLCTMMLWEWAQPKRRRLLSRGLRWSHNIALVFVNSIALRLLLPFATVGVASYAQQYQVGLFYYVDMGTTIAFFLTLILFDLAIYWQHRLFHRVPMLWALHKVHHVDQDIDVTTGARFHTIEIALSLLIKCALILLLGPPVFAIIVFEIVLNASAMFNHANVALPQSVDRFLRFFIVTPDMHRVHHSTNIDESNRNFGFNLRCWDSVFNSYQAQPSKGHLGMHIGVEGYQQLKQTQSLVGMLGLPFAKISTPSNSDHKTS